MPRGSSDIPELRLEVLQKFLTTFMASPDLMLMNLFPSSPSPSSTIKWESQRGGRGMTPFVAPGAVAPRTAPHGIAQHSAEAAYWKEKMSFDEEFLNNLRKEGTEAAYLSAKQRLARELALLVNRSNRRKEWMFSKMIFGGEFTYKVKEGYQVTVDYQLPSDHVVELGTDYNWNTGTSKNILKDIQDGKRKIKEDCGGRVNLALCNSKVLTYLANDTTIRGILQKNAFGDGSLYKGNLHDIVGVNPKVIGSLLDIDTLYVYDEMYEIRAWLTSAVVAESTTWISLDDVSDLEAGATLRFHDRSAGTYEDRMISIVDPVNSRVQIEYGCANAYKAGEDYVTMAKYFLPDDKFVMMATRVDGQPIAEYKEAPFGMGRHYGLFTDKNDDWDPEVTWIRTQNKGLPVLYQRDAIYQLDVVATAYESVTTTSTTTSSSSTTTTTG